MATNAIAFNGSNQYAQIDNFSGLDSLTDYTIEFYVKNHASSAAYSLISCITDGTTDFSKFTTENGVGNTGFNFKTIYAGTDADGFESGAKLPTGTWTHVSMVHDATLQKTQVFINGVENNGYDLQQTGTSTLQSSTGMKFRSGWSESDTPDIYFQGSIGGYLRVWNRKLNGAEIYAKYDKTLTYATLGDSSLKVNCNFSEGSGTVVDNDASAGDDLDLYNTPTWETGPTLTEYSYPTVHFNQVSESGGDSEENTAGTTNAINSSDLEVCYDGAAGYVGVRFTNVTIPSGATIVSAVLRLVGDEVQTGGTDAVTTIKGHDVDNSGIFTTGAADLSGRYTGASTTASSSWTVVGTQIGVIYTTSDISAIVQEIVDRGGWASGNAMSFIMNSASTNVRTFEAYDGQAYSAPMLEVVYTVGGLSNSNFFTFF